MLEELQTNFNNIKKNNNLILNLTNYVTMEFMANALLAIGASPIMSCSKKEVEELVAIASGININIGTLHKSFNKMVKIALEANENLKKPVILDPVGAGATTLRTRCSHQIFKSADIIKGNASEVLSLITSHKESHGVDSAHSIEEVILKAKSLSLQSNKIVVITGKNDFITSRDQDFEVPFGVEMMTKIVGTGCILGAIICSFASCNKDYAKATFLATLFYNLTAEYTYKQTNNVGTFRTKFLDNLNQPNWGFIAEKIEKLN